jgi:hypothetical protein
MSRILITLSALSLIATGCHDEGAKKTQSIGQAPSQGKPKLAIVPVVDNTKNDYAWNLSDELSSELYSKIAKQHHFAIEDAPHVRAKLKKFGDKNNPFASDYAWVKKAFQGDQYVAFMELVEHEEVIKQNQKKTSDPKDCNAELNMSMRIRVFDLRGEEPKVILQELVHDTHFIARPFTQENFYQVAWGEVGFNVSPIGLAHAEFTKEIADRIEDYILMSK